jgi:L-alanine-DL-glutamate epimerase-like enolase superfamily enzyme
MPHGITNPLPEVHLAPNEDGLLHIPEVPGVGLEWNEEMVEDSRCVASGSYWHLCDMP